MPERPEGPLKLPAFSSLDELVRFVDENDLGDYLDAMPEAHFEVKLLEARRVWPHTRGTPRAPESSRPATARRQARDPEKT